jgi:type I restriction enzyme S subunit
VDNLPGGWIRCDLGSLIDVSTGKLDANAASEDGEYPFFTCSETVSKIDYYAFDAEAVLLAGNGGFGLKWYRGKFNAYQRTYVLEPVGVDGRFLYRQVQWLLPSITSGNRGSTIRYIRIGDITGCASVLPPLLEQHRIVAKLEALTEKSRRAKEALDAIPPLLERFRQSVLASAFRGDLTAEWRAKNPDVEPADKLLQRIRTERRRRWEEAELARMQAKGKTPGDDRWKEKYEEPEPVDTEGLPELPEGWAWAKWQEIGSCQNGRAYPSGEYANEGARLLRPGNLHVSGQVTWTDANTKHMPETWATEYPEHVVGGNELVMNLTAQSLKDEFLGRVCLTRDGERCLLNQRIGRLTPVGISSRFCLWLFKSPAFRKYVDGLNKGSLIQHMFTSQVDVFTIPVPPAAEQQEIVRQIDGMLMRSASVEGMTREARETANTIDSSILAKAFRGDLVPQDPSDEPASVLLDRIRQERASASATATKKDKKAPKRR